MGDRLHVSTSVVAVKLAEVIRLRWPGPGGEGGAAKETRVQTLCRSALWRGAFWGRGGRAGLRGRALRRGGGRTGLWRRALGGGRGRAGVW